MRGKSKNEVSEKVRILERQRDEGKVRKAGQTWTVEQWLNHWLQNIIAPPAISQNAYEAYEVAARVHLIPGVGAHKLDKLEPEHLERFYRKMATEKKATKSGSKAKAAKPARVHQVHRTIRTALNEALKRKHITQNPASLARAPKIEEEEVEPYSIEEIKRLLDAAQRRRNSARWAIALALGLRQGEALGLMWSDLDLEAGTLLVRRSRQRPKWAHGCDEPCGRKYGGHCPQRRPLRSETAGTKSRAGKRGMGLPDPLIELLKHHRAEQQRERDAAGDLWRKTEYVFTTRMGDPLVPRSDYDEWKQLLKEADVPDRRLHDARHTAATVLLLLGVTERTTMAIMGWSNTAMAARYQHIVAAIRRQVADQVGGLLWNPPVGKTDLDGDSDGPSGAPAPAA